jgi:hypothetical protein
VTFAAAKFVESREKECTTGACGTERNGSTDGCGGTFGESGDQSGRAC